MTLPSTLKCLLFFPTLCLGLKPAAAQQTGSLQQAVLPPPGTPQEAATLGVSTAANATYTVAGAPFDDIGAQDSGVVKVFDTATGALLFVLANPSPHAFDYFGYAVALSGSKVVVGAYLDDAGALNTGIAYVYDLAGAHPTQPLHVLHNPAPSATDQFGFAVAASGQFVAVAAPLEDQSAVNSGTVYVYDMGSATPAQPVLTIHNPSPVAADQFGYAIALDGSHLLVGVPQKDIGATNAGSVELFNLAGANPAVPVASLPNPHPASADNFGNAVAIHGSRFVVGAALDDATATNSGRAYVYDFSGGYPATFSLVLENPTPAPDDQFGYAVTLHGAKVVVGTPYDDTGAVDSGRAYVYDLNSATPAQPAVTLARTVPAVGDRLSLSLAIHGNRVVAGVPYDDTGAPNTGSLAVFDLGGVSPGVPVAYLRSPSPSSGDLFGSAIAISGTRMVVGARLEDTGATNAGSAFVYELAGPSPATPSLILRNPNPSNGDEFGHATAISGSRVAVSAPYANPGDINDAGTVYVYDLQSATPHLPVLVLNNPEPAGSDQFGSALALSGDRLAVGVRLDDALAANSGSAYVYDLASATPGTPWLTLRNPTPAISDFFGRSVALHQNVLVIGASADDTGATDAGSAYVYDLTSADPGTPVLTLNNPAPAAGDQFGFSVAVSGPIIVVGANTDDVGAADAGSVYVYDLTKPDPSLPAWTLPNPQPGANDQFGVAVAIEDRRVAVGAHLDDLSGITDAGSVHVFDLESATPTVPELLLAAPGAEPGGQFGIALAISGERIVTGAAGADMVAMDKGAAYVFHSTVVIEEVDITVEQPAGVGLVSGVSTVSFGSALVGGTPVDLAWVVRSTGLENLQNVVVSIGGAHAADFTVTQTPSQTVPPGGSTGLAIRFTPSSGGPRNAQLSISSNDPNENPFVVTLSGMGLIPAPEIAIEEPEGNNLVAGVNVVSFGTVTAVSGSSTRAFTVRNTGTASLTGIGLSIAGTHAADFSVLAAPVATLAPGGSTTFTLRFAPAAGGARQARVSVASNDADENPFDIYLAGTGIVHPNLRVEQPLGSVLANGAATIDFGTAKVAEEHVDRTFTVRNTGSGVLSGLAVSIGGTHPGDYFVVVPPPASIAPGGSSTFTVRFTPAIGGTREATASLSSNDPDDNPFIVALTGSAEAVPNLSIEQPVGNPLFHDQSSVDFGNVMLGGDPAEVTFTLRNSGTDTLTGISPVITGLNAADFTLVSAPAVTLMPGQTTTLVIRFHPAGGGERFALLRVASNDPDDNPFETGLAGFAIPVPVIVIEHPAGAPLAAPDAQVDFGPANISQLPAERVFTIRNTGNGELSGINLQLTGEENHVFSVASFPAGILLPGEEAAFTIRFTPDQEGLHEALLRVHSSDTVRSPFEIQLRGTGANVPDIAVEQPQGNDLLTGATVVNFGDVEIGQGGNRTFTLRNHGQAELQNVALTLSGEHAADYTVVTAPPSTLAAGGSATFVLRFSPSADGTRTALARIASNDPDENPFDIPLTGKALSLSNLVIEQPAGTALTHAQSTVDFGSVELATIPAERIFTLRNTGTGGLNGVQVALSGGQASDYTVIQHPAASLLPGQSTTMVIRFNPAAAGTRQTTLSVASNDPNKNPFIVSLTGQGVAVPDIAVERPIGNALVSGAASADLGAVMLDGAPLTATFTVRNTGTGPLTGVAASITGGHTADFSVTAPPGAPFTLNPGQSITFTIHFAPTVAGPRAALLHVASNDPDENPFIINLTGTGLAAPDITVQQPAGVNLVAGSALVPFGSAHVQSGVLDRIFTVRNDGTARLEGIAVSLGGSGAADFQVLSTPATALDPGEDTTFSVRFAPVAGGDRAATLSIVSNDPDENPFAVTVTGYGIVTPNITVEQPEDAPLISGSSVADFGEMALGAGPVELVFTLRNTGTGALTLSGLTIIGANAADFTLAQPLPPTLAAGASAAFMLRFTPATAGVRTASARIFSDDPDTNPFFISLTGTGIALPDIALQQPAGNPLANGENTVAFGAVVLGAPPSAREFVLRNTGTGTLSDLTVDVTGAHAADFTVLSFRDAPLTPGESSLFTVHFHPAAAGPREATLVIGSNDPDENPFTVALSGDGLAQPDLQVEQPQDTPLAAGAVLNFGTLFVGGEPAEIEVTLRNTGTAVLNLLGINLEGSHPADFVVTGAPATALPPGETTAFTLRFTPSVNGARSATLGLVTNDPDENPFVLQLAGVSKDFLTEVFTTASPNDSAGATYTFRLPSGITPSAADSSLPPVESAPIAVQTGTASDLYESATVLDARQTTDPFDPERVLVERLIATSLKYATLRVEDIHEAVNGKLRRLRQSAAAAGHLIVRPKPGVTGPQLLAALTTLPGAELRKQMPASGIWLVGFQSSGLDSLPDAIAAVTATGLVEYAEPDYVVRAAAVPDDPAFGQQWALRNTGQEGGAVGVDIDAPTAWNIGTGSHDVLVAVIDSGIDLTHSDLAPNIWANTGETSGNGTDDDNNGYIDDTHGWNFVDDSNDTSDTSGHGTRCAGIIGAAGDNALGGAGVNWQVSLLPLKILDSSGEGFSSDAIEAVAYATSRGARVSCNAWGGAGYSRALQEVVEQAEAVGSLFVTAAGNEGRDIDYYPFFPAAFNGANVLTAAALNRQGQLAWFSNHGSYGVHLAAPGADIQTTAPGGGHAVLTGTSAAAAHVAGVAALVLASHPGLGHEDARAAILAGVSPSQAAADKTVTGGCLNAARALRAADTLLILPARPFAVSGLPGGPFVPNAQTYQLRNHTAAVRPVAISADKAWVTPSMTSGSLAPGSETEITVSLNAASALLPPGLHTARVTITDISSGVVWTREMTLNVRDEYYLTRDPAVEFPVDPDGGTVLDLADDSFAEITLADGATITFFGKTYRSVFVGSNGYVTFGAGDWSSVGDAERHFALPRLSALFADLDPAAGGTISWKQLPDRLAVTFESVPEHGGGATNSFQFQLFFDGPVAVTVLDAPTEAGVTGISEGGGMADGFMSSDLSAYPESGQGLPVFISHPASLSVLAGDPASLSAAAEGYGTITYQWYFNGIPLPDTNHPVFEIPAAAVSQSGVYRMSASNAYGITFSQPAALTVSKRPATIELPGLAQTYDGTPRVVTAQTNPPGLPVNITYNGGAAAPVNAGSYTIAAVIDDPIYAGGADGVLVVAQAAQSINFAAITDQLATATVPLSATGGGSGNPVTFTVTAGPGVITGGNSLTFTTSGQVSVTASQAGNANYEPASDVTRTFNVTKATAAITLANLEHTYDGTPRVATASTTPPDLVINLAYNGSASAPTNAGSYTVSAQLAEHPLYQGSTEGVLNIAKAAQSIDFPAIPDQLATATIPISASSGGSGNPVTFTVTAGPGVITGGNSLTFTGAGEVSVTASQAGGANHEAAPDITRTFNVTKATAAITLANLEQTYDSTPRVAIASTTPSGLTVNLTYDGSASAPVNAGSYAVSAVIDDARYQGSAEGTLNIAQASQSIDFPAIPDQLATATVTLSASGGGSGNPVTFAVTAGPGVITGGNSLTFTASGQVSVTASQTGNANYEAAPDVTRTFNVGKAAASISLANLDQTYDGTPRVVTASTTPSGLTVNLTYNGSATAPVNAGSYAVLAVIDDPHYQGTAEGALNIAKAAQSISFPAIPDQPATATVPLSATGGGSGNPVTFAVTAGPGVITGGNSLTFSGAGQVSVTASQAGNANYEAASDITHSFNVSNTTASVTLAGLAQTYDGTPRVVTAITTPPGLEVAITYDGSAIPPVNAGVYQIAATIINHPLYQGGATSVLEVSKAAQSISFAPISNQFATSTVALFATGGGSGNPVTFTVSAGPGVISGDNVLSFTGPGEVSVTASQSGNDNYVPAPGVSRSFTVSKTPAVLALEDLLQAPDGTPRPVTASTWPPGLPVQVTYDGGANPPELPGQYSVAAVIEHPLYAGTASGTLILDHRANCEIREPDAEAEPAAGTDITWEDTAAGIYDGLLRDSADGRTLLGAIEKLTVSRPKAGADSGGAATGKLRLNGRTVTLRGTFDTRGLLTLSLPQKSGGSVEAELRLQKTEAGHEIITGTVTWDGVTALARLPRAPFHALNNPAPAAWSGRFTLLLPSRMEWDAGAPSGDGWAALTVSPAGLVKVTGRLGDGTALTETAYLSAAGEFALFTELYRSVPVKGRVGGSLVFRDIPDVSDCDGIVQWVKLPDTREKTHAAGFAVETWALGSRHITPAAGQRLLAELADAEPNASLSLFGPGLPADSGHEIERVISWLGNNTLRHYGPEKLSGKAARGTGLVSGSYRDPATKLSFAFQGITFQKQGLAAGQFVAGGATGALRILPGTDFPYPGSEDAGDAAQLAAADTAADPLILNTAAFDTAAAGVYAGVVGDGALLTGGLENFQITATGAFTGTLWLDGARYAIKGVFDPDGTATATVQPPNGQPEIVLTLRLQLTDGTADAYHLAGTLAVAGAEHTLDAQRRPVFTATARAPQEGAYTLAVLANDASGGDGYATLKVSHLGLCTGALVLADGAKTTFAGHVSRDGEWSLHRGLYGGTPTRGLLAGKLIFRDVPGVSDLDGVWTWRKNPGATPGAAGFATAHHVIGARYLAPAKGARAWAGLADSWYNAWWRITSSDRVNLDRAVTWTPANQVAYFGPDKLAVKVNANTGLVSGSYQAPGTPRFTFGGVLIQKQSLVSGSHFHPDGAGKFWMEPR